jgi:hypothetical protein
LMFFKYMENSQYQFDEGLVDIKEYDAQRLMWVRRFEGSPSWIEAWDRVEGSLTPRLVAKVQPIVEEARRNRCT